MTNIGSFVMLYKTSSDTIEPVVFNVFELYCILVLSNVVSCFCLISFCVKCRKKGPLTSQEL